MRATRRTSRSRGRSGAYYERMNLPHDAVAVTLNLPTVTVTPEQAEQILKLWKPLGKFLAEMEPIKKPARQLPQPPAPSSTDL